MYDISGFDAWLMDQATREDGVGTLGKMTILDPYWPNGGDSEQLEVYADTFYPGDTDLKGYIDDALEEYERINADYIGEEMA